MNNELYHYGVKGMKWGVRKRLNDRLERKHKGRARKILTESAEKKNLVKTGPRGKITSSRRHIDSYREPFSFGMNEQLIQHIVDQNNRVVLSSIGDRAIASGKKHVESLNLRDYYIDPSRLSIEYDVYD